MPHSFILSETVPRKVNFHGLVLHRLRPSEDVSVPKSCRYLKEVKKNFSGVLWKAHLQSGESGEGGGFEGRGRA